MTKTLPRRLPPIEKRPDWVFALLFFLYPLVVGLLVQLVLLPYVFPAWHAGDGLLDGLDSRAFHRLAVQQAEKIVIEGWKAWSLAPEGQPVAGIASAFYALFSPHPWVLLPLNAILHALAAWTVYKTLRFFLDNCWFAILASLPIMLFPSSLYWVSQLHNDNYAVTGMVLLGYGCACFAREKSWHDKRIVISGILAFLSGGALVWLVRDYAIKMFTAVGSVILIFLIVIFLVRLFRSRWPWKRASLSIGIVILSFFAIFSMRNFKLAGSKISDEPINIKVVSDTSTNSTSAENKNSAENKKWKYSPWLPPWLDNQIRLLSRTRASTIRDWMDEKGGEAGSNIDTDVNFHDAGQVICYLPRAVQVGFLSPFPTDWFDQGKKAPSAMMRRISGMEMLFVYLCWPGLFYAIWVWRKRPELWIWLLFCVGMLLIYVLGTPNVGSLYRFRYPFIMPMVGLGTAGWITIIRDFSTRAKSRLKIASPLSNN